MSVDLILSRARTGKVAFAGLLAITLTLFAVSMARAATPTVISVAPNIASNSDPTPQNLTVSGTSFEAGAQVTFKLQGSALDPLEGTGESVQPTTIQVQLNVLAEAPGTYDVTVTNPGDQTGTLVGGFTIAGSLPTVTSVSPASRGAGAVAQVLRVTGTNFARGAGVTFSGTGITVTGTQFVGGSALDVTVDIAASAPTTGRTVTVTNTDGLQGTCASSCFTVNAGPTVTTPSDSSPATARQGETGKVITITGSRLADGAVVSSGAGITVTSTTYVPPTLPNEEGSLSATVNVTATAGAIRDLVVTNPDGGRTTCVGCLSIIAPAPTLTSADPTEARQGRQGLEVVFSGTGLVDGATLAVDPTTGTGVSVGTVVVNQTAQTLTATLNIAVDATVANVSFKVTNPDGGTSTCSNCFSVTLGARLTSAAPSTVGQGAVAYDIDLTGSRIDPGATVSVSGGGVTVDNVIRGSETLVSIQVTVAANAAAGGRNILLTNPNHLATTCTGCLTVTNAPSLTALTPNNAGQGAKNRTLTATATGFNASSVLTFGDGITATTTYTPGAAPPTTATLSAIITVTEGAVTGPRPVTITNGDGGTSTCTGCFTVNQGPTATGVTPTAASNTAPVTVTVTGTGFTPSTSFTLVGEGFADIAGAVQQPTTSTTSRSVRFDLTGVAPGPRGLRVTNPDGGTYTCQACFTVVGQTPTVTAVDPAMVRQGASSVPVTVTGTAFAAGSTAEFGEGVTVESTTRDSSTKLTVVLSVLPGAVPGERAVTVRNTDDRSGSCSTCFAVGYAAPTVTSLDPAVVGQGASNYQVTLSGTGLRAGATVATSGTGVTATLLSVNGGGTAATVRLDVAGTAPTGARTVTLTNTDGAAASCADCLTVNAAPAVTVVNPSSRGQGAANQRLAITATGFGPNTVLTFGDGITATTIFTAGDGVLTQDRLEADVTVAQNAVPGARVVTITNPDGGRSTCTSCFTVTAAPTITGAAPRTVPKGASAASVVLTGTGFVTGVAITSGSADLTVGSVTFNSATQVTITVSVTTTAALGDVALTATNPDKGTSTCADCLAVVARPVISSLSPSTIGQGANAFPVTATGTDFVDGATVAVSGTGVTVDSVSYVSATELRLVVTAAGNATIGGRNVTVANPDGGTSSCNGCLTVDTGVTVTTVEPATGRQADTALAVRVTGTGFTATSAVMFGAGVTVSSRTVESGSSILAMVNIDAAAATGTRDVRVTNADGGSGSCQGCFTVLTAAPTVTGINPSSLSQGANGVSVTVSGTRFVAGATFDLGSGVTVSASTISSPTSANLTVSVAAGAAAGTRNVTVTNSDGGSGTCAGCLTIAGSPPPPPPPPPVDDPTVTSSTPEEGVAGTNLADVIVAGSGFANGATVSYGAGITVSGVTFVNAQSITVDLAIAAGATPGDRDIRVTNPDGGLGICSACFTVVAAPATTTVAATGPSTVDSYAAATFSATGTAGDGGSLTYSWEFGDGTPARAGASVTHAFTVSATRTVTVTATDTSGNAETDTLTVDVIDTGVVGRSAGTSRVATAVAASRDNWTTSDEVLLATADNFPDALAAGPLANLLDAPLLLTSRDALADEVRTELARLDAQRVTILGGPGAVSDAVATALENDGYTVRRIRGTSRFDTANLVAREAGAATTGEAVIALGEHSDPNRDAWPDSLSAGSLAASPDQLPILLTRNGDLPGETESALAALGVTKVFLIGGPGAISAEVEADLRDRLGLTVERLAGANRYATSVAVAAEALSRFGVVQVDAVFATGEKFPDGLAGGAVAARRGGVVLLTPKDAAHTATLAFLAANDERFDTGIVVGGTGVVTDATRSQLQSAMRRAASGG